MTIQQYVYSLKLKKIKTTCFSIVRVAKIDMAITDRLRVKRKDTIGVYHTSVSAYLILVQENIELIRGLLWVVRTGIAVTRDVSSLPISPYIAACSQDSIQDP